jgi:hypothetical protein
MNRDRDIFCFFYAINAVNAIQELAWMQLNLYIRTSHIPCATSRSINIRISKAFLLFLLLEHYAYRPNWPASSFQVAEETAARIVSLLYFAYLFICLMTLCHCWALAAFSGFLSLYTFGRTPWTGHQLDARPLLIQRTTLD